MQATVIINIIHTLPQRELPAFLGAAAPIWEGAGFGRETRQLLGLLREGLGHAALDYLRSPQADRMHRTLAAKASLLFEAPGAESRWRQWARMTRSPKVPREIPLISPLEGKFRLRSYQKSMLTHLQEDLEGEVSPWLGIASPMQTGKSALIGRIIRIARRRFGESVRAIVVTSSENTTDQVIGDLRIALRGEPVGRFDRHVREVRSATVASIFSLFRYCSLFPTDQPAVLIFDQAAWTQTPIGRKIILHFGLGEEVTEEGKTRLIPKSGLGAVIGLSNTGWGLEGYHVSDKLDLWTAIKNGWIRHLVGDREFPKTTTMRVRSGMEKRMIWWRATRENAKILADIYDEKIHGRRGKKMIYVPTILHGELLVEELRRRHGEKAIRFVHSRMEEDLAQELARWHRDRSTLVSIRRVAVGTRATGVAATFHTYQSDSVELFGERTGRAWAVSGDEDEEPLDTEEPLYILEATWDRRSNFANLARLINLREYPPKRLDTREEIEKLLKEEADREAREAEKEELRVKIERGEVSPLFKKVPLVEAWRRRFNVLVKGEESLEALAKRTGIPEQILAGFALGALPTRRRELVYDKNREKPEEILELWVKAWEEVVDDLLAGKKRLDGRLEKKLVAWRRVPWTFSAKVDSLEEILASHFPWWRHQRWLEKFPLDRPRLIEALRQGIQDEQEGKEPPPGFEKANPLYRACRRAERIYAEGLTEELRPLREYLSDKRAGFISNWLALFGFPGGRYAVDRELVQLVVESGLRREDFGKDREKVLAAFRQALVELRPRIEAWRKEGGKAVRPVVVALHAHSIFSEKWGRTNYGEVRKRFRHFGASYLHPEIALLLVDAGVLEDRREKVLKVWK